MGLLVTNVTGSAIAFVRSFTPESLAKAIAIHNDPDRELSREKSRGKNHCRASDWRKARNTQIYQAFGDKLLVAVNARGKAMKSRSGIGTTAYYQYCLEKSPTGKMRRKFYFCFSCNPSHYPPPFDGMTGDEVSFDSDRSNKNSRSSERSITPKPASTKGKRIASLMAA